MYYSYEDSNIYKNMLGIVNASTEKKYDNLYTEIKKGLFYELYCDFPKELKNLIDMNGIS